MVRIRKCQECGHEEFDRRRCGECKLDDLDDARSNTEAGRLMTRALELDFVTSRFKVGWDEVSVQDVRALQVLKMERDRWEKEERDRLERERLANFRKKERVR